MTFDNDDKGDAAFFRDGEVEERADALFPDWKDEEARWDTLRELLAAEPARQRENVIHLLLLTELLNRLYPELESDNYRKFGWYDAQKGKLTADEFIDKLRLAKAAGSRAGKL